MTMGLGLGVLAAAASSFLGGTSVALTRYVIGATDPIVLGILRFGIGGLCLLPFALARRDGLPPRRDLPAIVALGLLFFGAFPWFFNASLALTTAARGSLALSTLPLLTLCVAALFGLEAISRRKLAGVLVAMLGVAISLQADLALAPEGAWKGDLLMVGAATCGAIYNVACRPYLRRASPLAVTAIGMLSGAAGLLLAARVTGQAGIPPFSPAGWSAVAYLGVIGAALTFWLWSLGLAHATPTVTALTVTVNPLASAVLGIALLDEPVTWTFLVGLVAVVSGLVLATRPSAAARPHRGEPAM